LKPPKVSLSRIEQEIDLEEIFGQDLSQAEGLKAAIGQAIIDRMVERTEGGVAFGGRNLASFVGTKKNPAKGKYSAAYAESLEFKAAGKSPGKLNMTLTGDMLASLDVLSTSGNKIKVGIADESQIPKAYNHIVGDTVPKRPFFGITQTELKDIAREFKSDVEALKVNEQTTSLERRALDIVSALNGGDLSALFEE
jgi:hypothetical protein